ncbi:MAG TPA: hypothetical protein VFS52_20885 [Steroidobacteraceae bacterium]|nr:hypothetical protein [Steroidobacteraceae bacterium]
MLALADDLETEQSEGPDDAGFRRVDRKFHSLCDGRLGHVSRFDVAFVIEGIASERFQMEARSGLRIGQSFFVGVTLAHDDTLEPKRIGDVTVGVLLDDKLEGTHGL